MRKILLTLLILLIPNILFAQIINFPIKKASKIFLLDGRSVELSVTNLDDEIDAVVADISANYFDSIYIQNNYATTASVALKANVLDVYNKTQLDGMFLNLDNLYPSSSSVLLKANNLSDINSAILTRGNLGLGTASTKNTGIAEGEIPLLGAEGKLSSTVIPALSLTNSYLVLDTTELLTLDVETGAITIVTNESKTYILHEQPFSTFENWWEIVSPTAGVTSVNTKIGAVTLDKTDIGLGNVLNAEQMTTLHPANTITGLGSGSATTVARTDDPSIVAVASKADKTYVDNTVENHINALYQHGLPSPLAKAGKFLKSNGSTYELDDVTGGATTSIQLQSEIAVNSGDNTSYDLADNYTTNTLQIFVNGVFYDSSLYTLSVVSNKTRITFNDALYASDEVSVLRVYGSVANPEDLANYYTKLESDATMEAYISSLNYVNKSYVDSTDETLIANLATVNNNLETIETRIDSNETSLLSVINDIANNYWTSAITKAYIDSTNENIINTLIPAKADLTYVNATDEVFALELLRLETDKADTNTVSLLSTKTDSIENSLLSVIIDLTNNYWTSAVVKTYVDGTDETLIELIGTKIETIYDTDDIEGSTGTAITLAGGTDITVTRTGDSFEIDYTGTGGGIAQIYANTDAEGSTGPNITLKEGSNVTITRTGDTFEISSTGGGSVSGGVYSAWTALEYPVYRTDDDTITMVDNATTDVYLKAGYPIKWLHGSTSYYAIINSVSSASGTTTVDICGAPFTISLSENLLYGGTINNVKQLNFAVNGFFADAAETTLLINDMFTYYKWDLPAAYLCKTSLRVKTLDSGANNSRVNITLGSSDVLTANTNTGLEVSTAWVNNTTDIDVSNYDVSFGDTVEIKVDNNSSNKDARDLSVQLNFVME